MSDKFSERLQRTKVKNEEEIVSLILLLKSHLTRNVINDSLNKIREIGGIDVNYDTLFDTIHCRMPLKSVNLIEDIHTVEYVDLESISSIEKLIDD